MKKKKEKQEEELKDRFRRKGGRRKDKEKNEKAKTKGQRGGGRVFYPDFKSCCVLNVLEEPACVFIIMITQVMNLNFYFR